MMNGQKHAITPKRQDFIGLRPQWQPSADALAEAAKLDKVLDALARGVSPSKNR